MHSFEMTPELVTGNAEFDTQHRRLFAMTNVVLQSRMLARDPHEFRSAVGVLASQLEHNFAFQESAMRQGWYDRRHFHSAFHDFVRRKAREIAERAGAEEPVEYTKSSICGLLEIWAIYHIRDADRQLAVFLNEQASVAVNAPCVRSPQAVSTCPATRNTPDGLRPAVNDNASSGGLSRGGLSRR